MTPGRTAIVAAVLLAAPGSAACDVIAPYERIVECVRRSQLVFYGRLGRAEQGAGDKSDTTQVQVVRIFKPHAVVNGKKEIVVDAYIPPNDEGVRDVVLFADVTKGRIVPYLSLFDASRRLPDFIEKALAMESAPLKRRLAFYFENLDNANDDLSTDAYAAFTFAPFRDLRSAKDGFSAAKLASWIQNPTTPRYRIGLYSTMLGLCGRKQDAALLQKTIEDPDRRPPAYVNGVMVGLWLLDRKAGEEAAFKALTNPKNDFNFKYAGLMALEVLRKECGVDSGASFAQAVRTLGDTTIADLTIDELRGDRHWRQVEAVLASWNTASRSQDRLMARSIVKYALQCPAPAAKDFVSRIRKAHPNDVAAREDDLNWERLNRRGFAELLTEQVQRSEMVLYGRFFGATRAVGGDLSEVDGSTQMRVVKAFKSNALAAGKTNVTLSRYCEPEEYGDSDVLVLAGFKNGRIFPQRIIKGERGEVLAYAEGVLRTETASVLERSKFAAGYLEHRNRDLAADALAVFQGFSLAEIRTARGCFDPKKLIGWISDPKSLQGRTGVYALMLGACGSPADAAVLRAMIEDPDLRRRDCFGDLMTAYCMLDPRNGTELAVRLIRDDGNDFKLRSAALKAMDRIAGERIGDPDAVFGEMSPMLRDPVMADLVVDGMRRAKYWRHVGEVLAACQSPLFKDDLLMRSATIRFALECPEAEVKAYLAKARREDPQSVESQQDVLAAEKSERNAQEGAR